MDTLINIEKVKRIWAAERELIAAIDSGMEDGILVEVRTERYTGGSDGIRVTVKQYISPQMIEEKK